MRTFLFIFFIIFNFCLIFKINQLFKPKTTAIAYGVSLIAVPLLSLAVAYVIKRIKGNITNDFQSIYIDIVTTLMIIIFLNLIVLLADSMVNKLLHFQETNNTANIGTNPVKFALHNKSGVQSFYKIAFFLGSILIFYGIWLGKK